MNEQALSASHGLLQRGRGSAGVLVISLLLVLCALALYNPSIKHDFVNYDDPDYVTNNAHVRQGLTWNNLSWALTSLEIANWHPVTWISHMMAVQFFGLNPSGHHLINVFLHALNVLMLFLLLRLATGSVWRSAMVAALFAVHPMNVESVAWVSERKGLLSTLFTILTFWVYVKYVRRPTAVAYLWVLAMFALALMAKPMAITVPFLLLLFDYWPLNRVGRSHAAGIGRPEPSFHLRRILLEKAPLLVMAAGDALVTFLAQRGDNTVGSLDALSLRARLTNTVYSYLAYTSKTLWPARLAVFYPHPEDTLAWWKVGLAAVFLLAVTAAVWRFRRHRYLLMGWLWYLAALLPVIGILQIGRQAMANRYAYIPMIGLFILCVWLASDLAQRVQLSSAICAAIGLVVLASLTLVTQRQIGYWRDTVSLFSHARDVTAENYTTESALSVAFDMAGQPDLALAHAVTAVRMAPRVAKLHYQLGNVLQHLQHPNEAIYEYRQSAALSSVRELTAAAHNNAGALLLQINHQEEALAEFNIVLQIEPEHLNSLAGRGLVEFQLGKIAEAQADFAHAARIAPSPFLLFWLGRSDEARGDLKTAMLAYQSALMMEPLMADARARLQAIQNQGSAAKSR
jgi:tetratricopeptide (TPR) repeat protein